MPDRVTDRLRQSIERNVALRKRVYAMEQTIDDLVTIIDAMADVLERAKAMRRDL